MDFRSLSRRELQALCKRNKIPANITNVAMADALADLSLVKGIDEFLNGEGSGVPESPMREEIACSENPRTALRTSTKRKAVKDDPKSSQPMTRIRHAAAARCTEESENRDQNVALTTPSLPTGRRRTSVAASACKKVDFQMTVDAEKEDNDLDQEKNAIEKTPGVPKSQKRVTAASTRKRTETRNNGATEQRVYSTRRSVRLLEKNMESLSLDEAKMEPVVAVHMSFDEMPQRTGPVKEEDTNLEVESKITDESERKLDDDQEKNEMESQVNLPEAEPEMNPGSSIHPAEKSCDDSKPDGAGPVKEEDKNLEVESKITDESESKLDDDQEKNEMESQVNLPEAEPEMNPDSSIHSAEKSCDDSKPVDKVAAPDDNLNVKCFSEVEVSEEEPSQDDDDAAEISAEEINDSEQLSLPAEVQEEAPKDNDDAVEISTEEVNDSEEISLPVENVDVTANNEESNTEVENLIGDDFEEESSKIKNSSGEEAQVDEVLSSVEDSEPTIGEEEEEALEDADVEGDKNELETVSVEAGEDYDDNAMKSRQEFPENVSEDLVDVKIQWQDVNDSEPKIPNDINFEKVDVVSVEEISTLGTQFPRPTVAKSPLKEQTIIGLLIDEDEHEDDEEKEKVEEGCDERQIVVEKNDMSLRQLRKMFKERLQLNNKKMDNAKAGEKVRTALQPVPENRMNMEELEKRF